MGKAQSALVGFVAAIGAVFGMAAVSAGANEQHDNPREIARLRAHFDSVLTELRTANVEALRPSQLIARQTLIARLEQYSAAGRFPHNHVRPGVLVPVFRDAHQTLCAMGFLIASTGRTDIVDYVTSTNNLAYIRELATNAALQGWLDSTGLTVAEASRIQPSYDGGICFCVPSQPDPAVRAASDRRTYAIVSVGGAALNGAATVFNLANATSRHKLGTWLGFAVGGAQMAYGAYAVQKHDTRSNMGYANLAIGATSAAIATWRHRQPREAKPSRVAVSVAPYAPATGGAGLSFVARM